MVILEAAFGVEQPDLESEAALDESVAEDTAEDVYSEESYDDSQEAADDGEEVDEFADFQEETGTYWEMNLICALREKQSDSD